MKRFCTVTFFLTVTLLLNSGIVQCRDNITSDMLTEGWLAWDQDSNGLIHIVWNNPVSSGRHYLYYCNYDSDTQSTSPHVKVGYTGGHRTTTTPDIAVDGSGNCHITWSAQIYGEIVPFGEDWTEKRKIMYTRRDSLGNWDSQTTQISGYWGVEPGLSSHCRRPDIEIDSSGNPRIVWSQRHTESHQHSYLDIYYRNSTDGGDTWQYEAQNGRHGYNVTHVDTSEWTKFLPQRPRFKIDSSNKMYIVYTCNYRLPSQGNDTLSAFYVKYDNGWPTDPMDTEITSTYIDKKEADIAIRYISGTAYPYITYTRKNGSTSNHERAIVRLAYLDTSSNWQDKLVFQDVSNKLVLAHFPCVSIAGSEICVAVKYTIGLSNYELSEYIGIKQDTTGSGNSWSDISVDDTSGAGYTSCIKHDSSDISIIYCDTVTVFGGYQKPDLFFDLN